MQTMASSDEFRIDTVAMALITNPTCLADVRRHECAVVITNLNEPHDLVLVQNIEHAVVACQSDVVDIEAFVSVMRINEAADTHLGR